MSVEAAVKARVDAVKRKLTERTGVIYSVSAINTGQPQVRVSTAALALIGVQPGDTVRMRVMDSGKIVITKAAAGPGLAAKPARRRPRPLRKKAKGPRVQSRERRP